MNKQEAEAFLKAKGIFGIDITCGRDTNNSYTMNLSSLISEATENDKAINALRFAMNIKDLWAASQYGTISADHEGEMKALSEMENMFKDALAWVPVTLTPEEVRQIKEKAARIIEDIYGEYDCNYDTWSPSERSIDALIKEGYIKWKESTEEVRSGRPMYMNREEAIEGLNTLERTDAVLYENRDGDLKINWSIVIDFLIESHHLTNHLPEGDSKKYEWIDFDWINVYTHPKDYGRYLVFRKNKTIHFEVWNGSGWAYNHNDITHWQPLPKAPTK